jgi:hypothetical protein
MVMPLTGVANAARPRCAELLPWKLLQSLRMMPVRFIQSTRLLYVVVCEGVDHAGLSAIEEMLHCQAIPCLVSDQTMDKWIEKEPVWKESGVQVFERTSGAAEMARITASYAGRLGADQIQIARCGRNGWARLTTRGSFSDLLFDLGCLYQAGDSIERLDAAG